MGLPHSELPPAPPPASATSPREILLDATALDAARAWKKDLVKELTREGRPAAGGWPGTINEARGRCGAFAARALAANAMPPLASTELGRLTRLTYDEARRLWRDGE